MRRMRVSKMRDVTTAKISSLCGAIWRTILNFYASQGAWVNCYRIHQKSLNFIYPFKFYSNFTNKNVSWLHFSWATQYRSPGPAGESDSVPAAQMSTLTLAVSKPEVVSRPEATTTVLRPHSYARKTVAPIPSEVQHTTRWLQRRFTYRPKYYARIPLRDIGPSYH